jgi:SNF2 family DNA or RNA helicase
VDSREQEAAEFKLKQRRFMVAQQRAGGKGHTWLHGTTVIYFSNSFSYEDRKQSEDRSHRRGQTADRVLYIDLVALDTVDERVLAALKAKKDLADFFKGSPEAIVQ